MGSVMPHTETGKTWMKLSLISEHAKRDPLFRFTSLAHLLDKEFLKDCYNSLNRNKAVGVDNVSWEDYGRNLDENLDSLVSRLKSKKYKPTPAKRVYIPKSETEKRPLGISALENKVVESGVTRILGSIYEQDFLDCSYGFRPKRNCHQALKTLNDLITYRPVNHVVESDIKGFFDNVSHEELMEFLRIRIADTSLLMLINKFLKAGYIDERCWSERIRRRHRARDSKPDACRRLPALCAGYMVQFSGEKPCGRFLRDYPLRR
jgi:retron-type reverse transcriptase